LYVSFVHLSAVKVHQSLTEVDHLIPMDPQGVQLGENHPLYFLLRGNTGVKLSGMFIVLPYYTNIK